MKTPVVTTTALLLATTYAAPSSRLADRVARRQLAFTHDPSPFKPATGDFQAPEGTNDTHVEYSSNWSGAVLESPPSGQQFKSVTASFVIPTPKVPSGGRGTYSASAWVGIDGDTYQNALFQTGCDFTASSSGGTSYDCWYEWIPNAATDFSGFTPQAGDTIVATVTASSSTQGVATLKNSRTGQSVSKTVRAPSSSASLGGQNAEWIVEDFESVSKLVIFIDVFADLSRAARLFRLQISELSHSLVLLLALEAPTLEQMALRSSIFSRMARS